VGWGGRTREGEVKGPGRVRQEEGGVGRGKEPGRGLRREASGPRRWGKATREGKARGVGQDRVGHEQGPRCSSKGKGMQEDDTRRAKQL
jgi:hypothetical protein